nr:hypothetical protein Iba_chr09eCG2160 [Ipomoea batatas]
MDWKLAKLSSSLTDDPAMLCLLLRSDWMLSMLLVSSSWLVALTLGLGSFVFLAEGGLDAGVAGEWWVEPGFWLDGEKGSLSPTCSEPPKTSRPSIVPTSSNPTEDSLDP